MPSTPLTIPPRPSVSSISTITSSSYEERRVSQPTIIPTSPNTPLIISSSSSSSSTSSMMRRSSSAPQPRRGSSLPSIPSSSSTRTSITGNTSMDDSSLIRDNSNTISSIPMDILQFISSTIEPSWEEIERSPLSLVPTILPISNTPNMDIDIVTFLREAPGVIRSPLSQDSSSFDVGDFSNIEDDDQDNFNDIYQALEIEVDELDINNNSNIVTPELKQVSLRTFLEEDSSRFTQIHNYHYQSQENSPNPSLTYNENKSSYMNPSSSSSFVSINTKELTMKEFFNNDLNKSNSKSRVSTFHGISSNTPLNRSRSSPINSNNTTEFSNNNTNSNNHGLGLNVRENTISSIESLNTKGERNKTVGTKVLKLAREAFKLGK